MTEMTLLARGVCWAALAALFLSGCGGVMLPKTPGGQSRAVIRVGGHPLQTVVGSGSVWVLTCDTGCSGEARFSRGRLVRLDAQSRRVAGVTRLADPGAVAVGQGAAWVTHFWHGFVSRVDVHTGRVLATIRLVLPGPIVSRDRAFLPYSVATGERAVWVSTARGWVARIDPRSNRVVAMIALPGKATGSVVAGLGGVWVAEDVLGLYRIDPVTYRISKVVIAGPRASRLGVDQALVGAQTIWVEGSWATSTPGLGTPYTSTDRAGLAEIGVAALHVIATVPIQPGPRAIVSGDGALWIASRKRPIVQRLDPCARRITQTIRVQAPGTLVAVTSGALWLTSEAGIVTRVGLPRGSWSTCRQPDITPTPPADAIVFDKAASDSLDARMEIAYVPAGGGAIVSLTTAWKGGMVAAEPRWSPDRSRIVFVMSPRGHLTRYAGDGDIYVMNADGTDVQRLTAGLDASAPAWSPDGSRIVFVKGQGQALVVMSADGSAHQIIASARGYYQWPAWSPNGRVIAYQSSPDRDKQLTAIFTIRPGGTGERQLTPRSASAGFPAWSPGGSRIAYSASDRLWVMNSDGTNARPVTSCRLPCVSDFSPAWSSDGSDLVFVRQEDGGGARHLYVLALSTGAVRPVTPEIRWAASPDWRR